MPSKKLQKAFCFIAGFCFFNSQTHFNRRKNRQKSNKKATIRVFAHEAKTVFATAGGKSPFFARYDGSQGSFFRPLGAGGKNVFSALSRFFPTDRSKTVFFRPLPKSNIRNLCFRNCKQCPEILSDNPRAKEKTPTGRKTHLVTLVAKLLFRASWK